MMNISKILLVPGICAVLALPLTAQITSIPVTVTPKEIPGAVQGAPGKPTSGYGSSTVQTQINVEVKDGVDKVHFIRDNTDPFVITKAYLLKNANPYAVRGYLLNLVNGTMISGNPVQVDALKFNDGSAVILVSAEDYRFEDTVNGEGIDKIVAKLDRADLAFNSNTPSFVYFPKINSAANMLDMIAKVGASRVDKEFAYGMDTLKVDSGLNALVVSAPYWSWKHIREMLEKYDTPAPQVRITYSVYEIYTENDDKIGVDFQSWKNNDGVDFFSTGARYRRNWDTLFTGGPTNNGTNSTSYWNFNPKWNTRYLDFLASNGHAKLLASGTVLAQNREVSTLALDYGFFYDRNDLDYTNPNTDIIPRQAITKILPSNILEELAPNLSPNGNYWRVLGNLAGNLTYGSTTAATTQEAQVVTEELNRVYDKNNYTTSTAAAGIIHGKMQLPMAADGFKFTMAVNPVVTQKATLLDFEFEGVSLIGWNSDGTPRMSTSNSKTKIQLTNDAQDFVVDDIQKVECVRGVAGLPFLKDLPFLGWLFGDENESTKKTRVVIRLHAEYATPSDDLKPAINEKVGKIVEDLEKNWNSPINNMGFQQILFDTDKWE